MRPTPAPTRPSGLTSPSQFGTTTIFDHVAGGAAAGRRPASALETCQIGVVLRAVLFVHGVLAVGLALAAADAQDWLLRVASASAAALPGTLAWLVVVCALRRWIARMPDAGQWFCVTGLGALAGAYGVWQVGLTGLAATHAGLAVAPLGAGAAFAAALFYALRLRARSQLPAVTAARLAELQSRIRPHFLFNTLNTAIALVRVDPARAEAVLEDLSELFRVALIESGSSVTLAEEVALAQRYLAIEQIRFGDRLRVTWDLDARAGEARVPPLLLQPLVENAVRHGVEPAPDGGWVRVRTAVRGGQVLIAVSNSLPPAGEAAVRGHGMALRNVKERLRLMHDVAAQFSAGPEHDTWRVHVVVPLKS